ncbi:MAG: hypothetical protein MAG431_00282 [Chloroflexi bacterium]|nr:hypothetical protein [Chloroflexota bacterium]
MSKKLKEVSLAYGRTAEMSLRQRLLDLLEVEEKASQMSFEEFLNSVDEDTHAEWVNGEMIMAGPASRRHQEVVKFLVAILNVYVEEHTQGVILPAPFLMRLEDTAREPDLIFLAAQHQDRLHETYLEGPADLVVEIISPESFGRDRGDKFHEYEEAGIPEYWLIDPIRERAEFYQVDEQNRYQLVAPDEDGVYHAAELPDFTLPVDWLWDPPSILQALKSLGFI